MQRATTFPIIAFAVVAACTAASSSSPSSNNAPPSPAPTTNETITNADADAAGLLSPKPVVQPACSGAKQKPGNRTIKLASKRSARLHVPPSYDPSARSMIVMSFHGTPMTAAMEQIYTDTDEVSDARGANGFLVVYPEGVRMAWNAGTCCRPGQTNVDGPVIDDGPDDVAYVRELLVAIEEDFCVDARRIFATGISNGGLFALRLGCEMADTFAAIAPVAGVLALPPSSCKPSRPIPLIQFHGTDDTRVHFNGEGNVMSVAATIAFWRGVNGCSDASEIVYQKGNATCVRWPSCKANAAVEQCTIEGGGHTWPGASRTLGVAFGATTKDISANDRMLEFFEQHPL